MEILRVKTISTKEGAGLNLSELPNFSATGSIAGMRRKYLPKGVKLVRCGNYIYNVDTRPEIYGMAK